MDYLILFNVVNFLACAVFSYSIVQASIEYNIPRNFLFLARLISFSFLSAGMFFLALTKPNFYVLTGIFVSAVNVWLLSYARKATTSELFRYIAASMFFWPYFVSYCMISLAYYDNIAEKLKKDKSLDDGYL